MKDLKSNKKKRENIFLHCYKMMKNSIMGVIIVAKEEQSFRVHLFFGFILPIILGLTAMIIDLPLTYFDWFAILGFGGLLLSAELMNTGVEEAINLTTTEYSLIAKKAKDSSSAAVLLVGLITFGSNMYIFINKLIELIRR